MFHISLCHCGCFNFSLISLWTDFGWSSSDIFMLSFLLSSLLSFLVSFYVKIFDDIVMLSFLMLPFFNIIFGCYDFLWSLSVIAFGCYLFVINFCYNFWMLSFVIIVCYLLCYHFPPCLLLLKMWHTPIDGARLIDICNLCWHKISQEIVHIHSMISYPITNLQTLLPFISANQSTKPLCSAI